MKIIFFSCVLLLVMGCEKSETTNNVLPTADFTFSKKASLPVTASFISTSTGANPIVSHLWDFGDPASGANNTSALTNPIHEYNTEGTYSVMLTTTDNMGQQDMAMMAVGVSLRTPMVDQTGASFTYSLTPSFPYVVTFVNNSSDATSNKWHFGEGVEIQNDSATVHHAYFNPGSYEVRLIATASGGSDTAITIVDIP